MMPKAVRRHSRTLAQPTVLALRGAKTSGRACLRANLEQQESGGIGMLLNRLTIGAKDIERGKCPLFRIGEEHHPDRSLVRVGALDFGHQVVRDIAEPDGRAAAGATFDHAKCFNRLPRGIRDKTSHGRDFPVAKRAGRINWCPRFRHT